MPFLYIFTFCTLKLSEVLNISAIFFKQGLLLSLFPEQTGYHKREKEMRPRAASDIYAIISQVQGTWRTGFQRLDKIKSRTKYFNSPCNFYPFSLKGLVFIIYLPNSAYCWQHLNLN